MVPFKSMDPKRLILNWRFLSAIANSKFMHATVSHVLVSGIERFVKDVTRYHFRLNQKFNVRGFGDTGMKSNLFYLIYARNKLGFLLLR